MAKVDEAAEPRVEIVPAGANLIGMVEIRGEMVPVHGRRRYTHLSLQDVGDSPHTRLHTPRGKQG